MGLAESSNWLKHVCVFVDQVTKSKHSQRHPWHVPWNLIRRATRLCPGVADEHLSQPFCLRKVFGSLLALLVLKHLERISSVLHRLLPSQARALQIIPSHRRLFAQAKSLQLLCLALAAPLQRSPHLPF